MSLILHIYDFQGIQEAHLLLEGFVVFQGDSNRGKSSGFRALETLLTNKWNAKYMRRGTKKTRIELEFLTPNPQHVKKISYIRTKKSPSYEIEFDDGRDDFVLPKAGVQVPQIIKDLGFNRIETERKDIYNMNLHGAMEKLFLVTDNEPAITGYLNYIFKTENYAYALKKMLADKIDIERKHVVDSGNLVRYETDLEVGLADLVGQEKRLEELKAALFVAKTLDQKSSALIIACDTLRELQNSEELRDMQVESGKLEMSLNLLQPVIQKLGETLGVSQQVSEICNVGETLEVLQLNQSGLIPKITGLESLKASYGNMAQIPLEALRIQQEDLLTSKESSEALGVILNKFSTLPESLSQLQYLNCEVLSFSSMGTTVSLMESEVSQIKTYTEGLRLLQNYGSNLLSVKSLVQDLKVSQSLLEQDLNNLEQAEKVGKSLNSVTSEFRAKLALCPLCGGSLKGCATI